LPLELKADKYQYYNLLVSYRTVEVMMPPY
jgi:hypothetical protein